MKESKLIQLLSTFSTKEIREFQSFVYSPFYNKQSSLCRFYDYLKKLAPKFSSPKFHRKKAFQAVFPNEVFEERKLNYLMSDLLKLAEGYIGLKEYQANKNLQYCNILSAYLKRNLDKHYQEVYRKAERNLESIPTRNTDFYYQQYLLAEIAEQHFEQQKLRVFNHRLQEVADSFDLFYLSKKLEHSVEMLEWQHVLAHDYDIQLMEGLITEIQAEQYQRIPSIAIYSHIYFMLNNVDAEGHFQQLKMQLKAHFDSFTKNEMKQSHLAAINFCMRQIRKGKTQYQQELLDLYLSAIERKLLFENGYLSPWTFKNVVKLGLIMKRLNWTESFIETYSNDLETSFRKDAYHYSFADLYYHKKDYAKAQEYLSQVEFSDVFYSLGTRLILCKIYHETGEEESLLSLIASFKIFLKRNQLISDKNRETYNNFLYFLSQLTKGNQTTDLKTAIKETKLLADRTWLLKQLN